MKSKEDKGYEFEFHDTEIWIRRGTARFKEEELCQILNCKLEDLSIHIERAQKDDNDTLLNIIREMAHNGTDYHIRYDSPEYIETRGCQMDDVKIFAEMSRISPINITNHSYDDMKMIEHKFEKIGDGLSLRFNNGDFKELADFETVSSKLIEDQFPTDELRDMAKHYFNNTFPNRYSRNYLKLNNGNLFENGYYNKFSILIVVLMHVLKSELEAKVSRLEDKHEFLKRVVVSDSASLTVGFYKDKPDQKHWFRIEVLVPRDKTFYYDKAESGKNTLTGKAYSFYRKWEERRLKDSSPYNKSLKEIQELYEDLKELEKEYKTYEIIGEIS